MPSIRKIFIETNTDENGEELVPRVTFRPDCRRIKTRTQISWTNNDSQPHWPGRLREDGKTIDRTFFMPNPIAPNGDQSARFGGATDPVQYEYACSLHLDEQGNPVEKGTIKVT